ncbi:hypothetical protein [Pseudomonas sp. S1_E04]
MRKYKLSTRLTEINSIVIEQLRKEYNKISPTKFSLSNAFKQHFLNGRSHIVISKNANALEFRKYNQMIVNLHTNINRVDTSNPVLIKTISRAVNKILEARVNIKPLLFDSFSIQTSKKPIAEVLINQPLFVDPFSKREKQYTISFSQKEFSLYKEKLLTLNEKDKPFSKQLHKFLNDFSVCQLTFSNPNISFASDEGLTKASEYIDRYIVENSTNEMKLNEAVDYSITRLNIVDEKLMAGSTDLFEVIAG